MEKNIKIVKEKELGMSWHMMICIQLSTRNALRNKLNNTSVFDISTI